MYTSTVITISEKPSGKPRVAKHEADPATRLSIGSLVKICLAVVFLYSALFYFYQLPHLHQLMRTSGPFAVNECQVIQSPTPTPVSPTMVQIDWITSCRLDSTIVSYKPAPKSLSSSQYQPNSKFSQGALVQSGVFSTWFHYRATLYVNEGTGINYRLYAGVDSVDKLPPAHYQYSA
ncbi:hypothetical protein FB645_001648 [Coemansia sp. IMI 203386]|nr:hypothetical protein FB645_001648 [Coemansia sp. IMI 203386]